MVQPPLSPTNITQSLRRVYSRYTIHDDSHLKLIILDLCPSPSTQFQAVSIPMQEAMATFPRLSVLCNRHPMQSPRKLKFLEHNQKQHGRNPGTSGQTSLDLTNQPTTTAQPYANRQHSEEDVKRMGCIPPASPRAWARHDTTLATAQPRPGPERKIVHMHDLSRVRRCLTTTTTTTTTTDEEK